MKRRNVYEEDTTIRIMFIERNEKCSIISLSHSFGNNYIGSIAGNVELCTNALGSSRLH
jgi:hypothetical protein